MRTIRLLEPAALAPVRRPPSFPAIVRCGIALATGMLFCGGCGDGAGPEAFGALAVTVFRWGGAITDPGLSLSPEPPESRRGGWVAVDDSTLTVLWDLMTPGVYSVNLDLPPRCSVQGPNPRAVTITAGHTTHTSFQTTCSPAGGVALKIETCGANQDPDGYTLSIDGHRVGDIGANHAQTYPVATGLHKIRLSGVAANCTVFMGEDQGTVDVREVGDTVSAVLAVYCDPERESKIAFQAAAYISVMASDGRCRVPVTSVLDNVGYLQDWTPASWSPDGSKLAFTRGPSGLLPMTARMYIINSDGSSLVNLTPGLEYASSPAWSPDGGRIAFVGAPYDSSSSLYLVSPDGSGLVRLDSLGGSGPSWSPDGTRLAYSRAFDSTSSHIYVTRADGSGTTQLTSEPAAYRWGPAWSPDGSRLTFTRSDTVYVMDADGGNPHQLCEDCVGAVGALSWSPDGSRIAFGRDMERLCVVSADGSDLRELLTRGVALWLWDRAWSADGRRILFTQYRDNDQRDHIMVINDDGTGLTDLGPGHGPVWWP